MDNEHIEICINIIEFFKNDSIVIKDFLLSEFNTPWDIPYMMKYNIDKEQLIYNKQILLTYIIEKYYEYLKEQSREDKIYVGKVKTIDELQYLFYNDETHCIRMVKYFVNYLSEIESFNISTKNLFKHDIVNINEIISSERDIMGLNTVDKTSTNFYEEFQKKYSVFSKDLFDCIKQYIDAKIEDYEEEQFINYLFSLAYAYIKFSEETNEELDKNDKEFLNLVESDIDLVEYFYAYPIISTFVVECIYDCVNEYNDNYDVRHFLTDDNSNELFNKLDSNYESTFDSDFVINSIALDNKLNHIMSFFRTQDLIPGIGIADSLSNDSIVEILDGKYSMYEPLIAIGLDGRYEEEYKRLIIRKIVTDVYEYINYTKVVGIDNEYKDYEIYSIYDEIDNMEYTWKNIYSVFYNNYSLLLDMWYTYNSKNINYKTKSCLKIKEDKKMDKILKMYYFSIYKYSKIYNIKELKSVDMMNQILEQLSNNIVNIDDKIICLIMCLNVYERLLINEQDNKMVNILSNESDLINYFSNNKEELVELVDLYKKLNTNMITYIDESKIRKNIKNKEYVNVIKKLNPYDEEF